MRGRCAHVLRAGCRPDIRIRIAPASHVRVFDRALAPARIKKLG
ncbi:hypothetical protein [Streptomyces sp. NPDC048584]